MDSPDVNAVLDQIEDLLAEGNSEEALGRLQELYSVAMPSSTRGRALALEVIGLEEQARPQEANRLIETTMKEDGDDLGFILAAGIQFSELDAVDFAEVFLKNLCQLDPENHIAWFNLGVALGRAGRHEESQHCYEQALQREPDYEPAILHAGFALRMQQKPEEALERYRAYTDIASDDPDGWIGMAQLLSELNRTEEAYGCFERLVRLDPQSLDAYFDWAVTAIRTKDDATVARCVERMREINPDDWRTQLTSADYEETQGETWKAWEQLTAAFDEVSDNEEADPDSFDFVAGTLLRFASRNKMQEYAGEYVDAVFEIQPISEEVLDALLLMDERLSGGASSYQVVLKGSLADRDGHLQTAYRVYGVAANDPEEAGLLATSFEERCTDDSWQVFNVMQISPPDEGPIGVYWMSELLDRPPTATPERS